MRSSCIVLACGSCAENFQKSLLLLGWERAEQFDHRKFISGKCGGVRKSRLRRRISFIKILELRLNESCVWAFATCRNGGIRTVDIRFEIVDHPGLHHIKNFVDFFDSILWGDAILHHHKAISCVANKLADRNTQIERQLFKLVNGGDTTTLDVGDKAGADAALLAGGGGADPPLCAELFDILHKKIDIQGRSLLY